MRRHLNIRLVLATVFFGITLIAGFVYWQIWQFNPDYFVVHQEVNLYPISSLYALWEDHISFFPQQTSDLSDLSKEAAKIAAEMRLLREQKANLRGDLADLEQKVSEASKKLKENQAKHIEDFRTKELKPFESQRDQLQSEIEEIEKQLLPKTSTTYMAQIIIGEKRLQLADHNILMAQKQIEVSDKIIKEYVQFATPEDLKYWEQMHAQNLRALTELNKTVLDEGKLRGKIYDLAQEWRKQRVHRLGIWDFFYFSLGVATTTTFGDIIPNHRLPRALITIQLLISIVIVGLFVNSLSADLSRHND